MKNRRNLKRRNSIVKGFIRISTKIFSAIAGGIKARAGEFVAEAKATNLGYAIFKQSFYFARFVIYLFLSAAIIFSVLVGILIIFGLLAELERRKFQW